MSSSTTSSPSLAATASEITDFSEFILDVQDAPVIQENNSAEPHSEVNAASAPEVDPDFISSPMEGLELSNPELKAPKIKDASHDVTAADDLSAISAVTPPIVSSPATPSDFKRHSWHDSG